MIVCLLLAAVAVAISYLVCHGKGVHEPKQDWEMRIQSSGYISSSNIVISLEKDDNYLCRKNTPNWSRQLRYSW